MEINRIKWVDALKAIGIFAIYFGHFGKDGGKIAALLNGDDVLLNVPHPRTARIQEIHILLIHALCDGVDYLLLGGD